MRSTGTASTTTISATEFAWTKTNPLLRKYFFTSFPSWTDKTPGFSSAIVGTCPGKTPICPVVAGIMTMSTCITSINMMIKNVYVLKKRPVHELQTLGNPYIPYLGYSIQITNRCTLLTC
ncbi:hypothetical protein OIU84_004430 [Salix udensis]|uniref:Uncharacterized protein n=1 Tax=Salix udensis TaxID=889485 RepID=A0AAD6K270_9ROSI|nr:hypothetical protein OIU84_004430 [Salix udensis]